jgi:hypothetical protein
VSATRRTVRAALSDRRRVELARERTTLLASHTSMRLASRTIVRLAFTSHAAPRSFARAARHTHGATHGSIARREKGWITGRISEAALVKRAR